MSHTLFFPTSPDENSALLQWAARRIPWMAAQPAMRAIGVVEGPDLSHPLLAVCIYHNFVGTQQIDGKPWYGYCEISFAADSPKWATRRTISNLLRIPFLQYNCRKVMTVIPSTNKRAIRFNEGIGLKPEGTLRHQFAKNVHACIFGMMRGEFEKRWLNPLPNIRRPTGSQVHGQQVLLHPAIA
jgi:RimJ/RimL family protein N-acetyltransferase